MYIKISTVSTQPIKLLQISTHLVTLRFQLTLELQNLQSTPLAQWPNLPSKVHGPAPLPIHPGLAPKHPTRPCGLSPTTHHGCHECCVCSILFLLFGINGWPNRSYIYIILIYDNMKDHNRSFLNKCKFCCPNCYVMSHASLSMASNGGSPGAPHFKSCHFKRVIVAIIVFWSSCGAGSFFKTRQPIDKPNHTYMAPLFPAAQIAR